MMPDLTASQEGLILSHLVWTKLPVALSWTVWAHPVVAAGSHLREPGGSGWMRESFPPGGTHTGPGRAREGQGSGSGGKTAGLLGIFRTWEGAGGIGPVGALRSGGGGQCQAPGVQGSRGLQGPVGASL